MRGRIFPMPETIRYALTDLFCHPANVNKDFLTKLYLGLRRFGTNRHGGSIVFLRNYKFHLENRVKTCVAPSVQSITRQIVFLQKKNTHVNSYPYSFCPWKEMYICLRNRMRKQKANRFSVMCPTTSFCERRTDIYRRNLVADLFLLFVRNSV